MESARWISRINSLGGAVGGDKYFITLEPEELAALAEQSTGLSYFGNDDWRVGYYNYFSSMDYGNSLSTLGRILERNYLLRSLRNRLLVMEEIRRQPSILSESIDQPIFIVGNPRSGTSILFELLSQDRVFRSPLTWEAHFPVLKGRYYCDLTEEELVGSYNFLHDIQPAVAYMHESRWDLPAECIEIMRTSFFPVHSKINKYSDWLGEIELSGSYEWHKKITKLLQSQSDKKSLWLFKCPLHLHFLDKLFALYPDARFIYMHRDPAKSMASFLSLRSHLTACISKSVSINDLVKEIDPWRIVSSKTIDDRENGRIPDCRIIDVGFVDLMRDPVGTIKGIYDRFGLCFSAVTAASINSYLKKKPRKIFSQHKYAASDFGLSEGRIRENFKRYIEYYGVALE